jgi:hypothetical protein
LKFLSVRLSLLNANVTALLCLMQFTLAATARAQDPTLPTSQVIGLVSLKQRVGPMDVPTGLGVVAAHVEGGKPNEYTPNVRGENFAGVNFMLRSGVSGIGGHAHATAKIIYGPHGIAPGIAQVNCYQAANWLKEGCLFTGTNQPPRSDGSDIINNSWIANDTSSFSTSALRRLDYLIDTTDSIVVIGVNNGPQTPVPPLLASCYNGIAVGMGNGQSSGGRTTFEGVGRGKPDLVAPGGLTSFCTPVVSGVAACMVQLSQSNADPASARKAPVIKAVLMAGAVKPENWKHYPDKPLDYYLGAGIVNIDHSHAILSQPPSKPGMINKPTGWSYVTISPRDVLSWYWDVPTELTDTTLVLVWNRRIDGRQISDRLTRKSIWLDTPRLADMDLKLLNLNEGPVASSHSTVDNVELIHIPKLKPGQYEIQLTRKDALVENWTAALAWWGNPDH